VAIKITRNIGTTDIAAGADTDFVGICVHQTWVVLVATTISPPAPTPILSARVRPPLLSLLAHHFNQATITNFPSFLVQTQQWLIYH
jgi:hypothetical protein